MTLGTKAHASSPPTHVSIKFILKYYHISRSDAHFNVINFEFFLLVWLVRTNMSSPNNFSLRGLSRWEEHRKRKGCWVDLGKDIHLFVRNFSLLCLAKIRECKIWGLFRTLREDIKFLSCVAVKSLDSQFEWEREKGEETTEYWSCTFLIEKESCTIATPYRHACQRSTCLVHIWRHF